MYTARAIVDLQRAAATRMAERMIDNGASPRPWRGIYNEVTALFPYPKVTRPRVVNLLNQSGDPFQLRLVNGQIEHRRNASEEWRTLYWLLLQPNMIDALRDLMNNPTEEVEA